MPRSSVFLNLILFGTTSLVLAQTPAASDPTAVALAAKATAALTGGNSISDVTLNVTVTSTLGDVSETGTGTLEAKGTKESRVDVNFNGDTRSDVRNMTTGIPGGAWEKNGANPTPYAGHNCWTDAVWFFPALSSLKQSANSGFVFAYIGQEQHGGVNTQHIRVYQWSAYDPTLAQLSTIDFYLDPLSSLPLAIGSNLHPDDDMGRNISVEIDFSSYEVINGIQVPFHIQQNINGKPVLDATVTNAIFNTGLPDTLFTLQ